MTSWRAGPLEHDQGRKPAGPPADVGRSVLRRAEARQSIRTKAGAEPAALDGPGSGSPTAVVEDNELGEIMRAEIRKLPDREKLVLSLYYDEGLTLAEIGQVLGVTESRVSQIHTKSVLHLRSRLTAAGVG